MTTTVWLKTAFIAMMVLASAIFVVLNPNFVADFKNWMMADRDASMATLGVLLLFFGLTQLFIIPSGSAILLIAGAVIGPKSGLLYFAAMLATSPIVYSLAKTQPEYAQDILSRLSKQRRLRTILTHGLSGMQSKPIIGMGALRLMPMVPSALAVLAAAAVGLSLRGILIGTALFGFFRPLAISTIGYSIGAIVITPGEASNQVVILVLIVGLSTLAASVGLLRYLTQSSISPRDAKRIRN